jgi:signal transduction histidine kinase
MKNVMPPESPSAPRDAAGERPPRIGLSARLLGLTVLFVMLAEVLIYVPSIANFRLNWLNDRIAAAQVAALVVEAAPDGRLPPGLASRLVSGIDAYAIAVKVQDRRQLITASDMPLEVSRTVDLREGGAWIAISDAFTTLVMPDPRPIRVVGEARGAADFVEVVIDEAPLREAMLVFSRNILFLSLIISGITAGLVYLALHALIVRPVRRVADNVLTFEADPEDESRRLVPSGRQDEVGLAERAIARMQTTLAQDLRQRRHLAALGLAVSKINHDLRNMLATAQLLSDRLSQSPDPTVQRFAPKLIATLDRAIGFCQATLAYGRAAEPAPQRRLVALAPLIDDMASAIGLDEQEAIRLVVDSPAGLEIDADPDQLLRVLVNLGRNAMQALVAAGAGADAPAIRIEARREAGGVRLRVSDNGPGLQARARDHLFAAFQGSTQPGGTGLGLAIAAEIVRLHGGTIELESGDAAEHGKAPDSGASFLLTIPDRVRRAGA